MFIQRKTWKIIACALGIVCVLAIPAQASSLAITYSYTDGTATVVSATDTTLTLQGQFSGASFLSTDPGLNAAWNPVTYSDLSVADLTTGLLNGHFSFMFANGDTLSGDVFEDVSAVIASPDGTGPFTQTLTFTGGTGEFAGATGSASGSGFVGATGAIVSGSGTVDAPTIPEPASIALVAIGIGVVLIWRRRSRKAVRVGTLGLVLALGLLLVADSASADQLAYVQTSNPLTGTAGFGTLDLSTGAYQPIGPGPTDPGAGLVPASNGSLLTLGYGGNLDAFNPAAGAETLVGATGLGDCSSPPASPCGPTSANAFGGLNGSLYATDFAGNLYSVNPATGHATLIGKTGLPAITFVPFSMNADGTLNVFDENLFGAAGKLYATEDILTVDPNTGNPVTTVLSNALYQVDPTTGQAAFVAATTTPLNSLVEVNGTVYGFNGATDQILAVNLTNGNTSVVTDYDPAAGFIFGAAPTPEPASLALVALGVAIVLVLRILPCRGR